MSTSSKKILAVMDQGVSVNDEFLERIFDFDVKKLLITRQGKTVAAVVKQAQPLALGQMQGYKVLVFSYGLFSFYEDLPLSSLVRMATEGEVALALEIDFDCSEYLVLTPSTEKFDPDGKYVVVLHGEDHMSIGYQLYCADRAVGKYVHSGQILDFPGYLRAETERMYT